MNEKEKRCANCKHTMKGKHYPDDYLLCFDCRAWSTEEEPGTYLATYGKLGETYEPE